MQTYSKHLYSDEQIDTEEGLEWAIPKLGAIGIRAAHELHKRLAAFNFPPNFLNEVAWTSR